MSYSTRGDAFARGCEYLLMVQRLALEPKMVDVMDNLRDRIPICTFVGENIQKINNLLNTHLQACHECFHPQERKTMQIFAVPLAQPFGLDGICNIFTTPITIFVDVGRVVPENWLHVVAHEYAHAHLGESGHSQRFGSVLSHLCLGLGLEPPCWEIGKEVSLRSWPYCESTKDPLEFWLGSQRVWA
ncbi:hypothetical protein G7B40_005825 [Aetokthonos hydrillicola Thurmond2011]|uniref:Uncharacterized protein n=1 Tax=Aetokthonos hydrillicola Thurmond2011 TaxID=2712845 RepID=A0AAP5I3I2_9CYAN|nr:hypothetical protein [Aetokthonos hydrillicola]MBO3461830.1 hypothetical protein [Aetokthonos hydrillicola CCALA 1050]MBW4588862.1 hypothetical protein [Aetokthonos hydrillicola CCALA 1050]MDR9894089.1 hypothetical protein [Aetokthonos hydrillicola Thurmond2011]